MSAIERQAQAWVVRLDSGRATADDARAFRLWCGRSRAHASAFGRARAVWTAMAPAARGVAQREQRQAAAAPRPGRRAFLGGAVAASLTYVVARPPLQLWPGAAEWAADYRTGTGEQREVALADGVLVQMNTQTRLDVGQRREGSAQLDLLAGEAEFQAGPGGGVRVRAGAGAVTAARARFNVRHTGAVVCVTCLAGRVRVAGDGGDGELGAGEQLSYGPDGVGAVRPADAADVSAWRQRVLVFRQTALADVVAEVNRYRPGKLILRRAELGGHRVQARVSLDRLDDLIALIRDAYGARVTRLPGGIVLLG